MMEILFGIPCLIAAWLWYLTTKLNKQKRITKSLEERNRFYLQEINALKYGQETKTQTQDPDRDAG